VSVEPVFSHFYVDCLGSLCAYSIQYNYAIVFHDQVSRYPHFVPLRSIAARIVVMPCFLFGSTLVF